MKTHEIIYFENPDGTLHKIGSKKVLQKKAMTGTLSDGRQVFMQIIKNREIWYVPHKYSKGEAYDRAISSYSPNFMPRRGTIL